MKQDGSIGLPPLGLGGAGIAAVAAGATGPGRRRVDAAGPGDADGPVDGRRQLGAELPCGRRKRVLVHARLQLPDHGQHLRQLGGQRALLAAVAAVPVHVVSSAQLS